MSLDVFKAPSKRSTLPSTSKRKEERPPSKRGFDFLQYAPDAASGNKIGKTTPKWIVEGESSHNVQDASDPKVTSASDKNKWIVTSEPSHNAQDMLEPRDILEFYDKRVHKPELSHNAWAVVKRSILKEVEKELNRRDIVAFDSDFYSNFIKRLPDARTGMASIFDLSGDWFDDMFDPEGLSNEEARKADAAAMITDYITAKQEFINSMKDD